VVANQIGVVGVGVEVDASDVPKQLDKQLGKNAGGIGSKIGGLVATGLKVGLGGAAAGIGAALGASLFAGFSRLTQIDNAKAKLEGLKFSAEQVQSTMDSALKSVKGTAFGLGEAATVAAIFGATGVKAGEDMTRVLKLTADAATVGGTNMAEMGDIISDVAAMGKVSGDTLNRMGERGIDALGNIARHMGVSREAARDMVSEGDIDFQTFAASMEENIGGAAMSSGKTFQGAMANIMAAVGRLGADALGPVFEAIKGASPAVIEAIDGMTAAFKPIFEDVGPKVAAVVKDIGDTIGAIDWTAVAATVQSAWEGIEDLFTRLADKTTGFADRFAPVWEGVGTAVNNIDWQLIGDTIVGVWEVVIGIFQGVYDAVQLVIDAVQPELGDAFGGAGDVLGETDWAGIADIFRKWTPWVIGLWGAFKLMQGISAIFNGIKTAVIAAKGAMFLFQVVSAGAATAQEALAFAQGEATAATWLQKAAVVAGTAVEKIRSFWTALITGQIWAQTAALLANPITWIVVGIVALIAALVLLFLNWDKVVKFLEDTWKNFMAWITPVLDGFVDWWTETWDTVVSFFTDIWEGVTDWFQDTWDGLISWFKGLIDGFMAWWTPIWDVIWSVIKLVIDLVVNYFRFWAAVYKWLWEHAVQPALQAIADFFTWLWEEGIKPIIDSVVGALEAFGDAVVDLWETYVQPAIQAIGDFFTWLWEETIKVVIGFIEAEIKGLGIIWQWLYDTVIKPVGDAIAAVFKWLWENGIKPIIDYVVLAIEGWAIIFRWLYEQVIKPVWEGIQGAFKSAWDWINRNVFTPFKDGIGLIQQAFQNVADALPAIWNSIKKAVADPINFVLIEIWNKGLRSFWNDLVTELDLKDMKLPAAQKISFAKGGVLPGYTPGRDVHHFFSRTGGRLDLSGGEGIIRPDALRRLGGKRWLDAVNGSRGRRGIGDGQGDKKRGFLGDAFAWIADTAQLVGEFLLNPAKAIDKYLVQGLILDKMGGQNIFGQTIAGLAVNTVRGLAHAFDILAPTEGNYAASNAMGWKNMWAAVQKVAPWATLNSAYRSPASNAAAGGVKGSYHTQGRAIDLGPANMRTFNMAKALFPSARELIYTPAGAAQLLNGRSFSGWSDYVKRIHYSHIHVAMKKGGVFDNGGWLQPGGMGMNMGSKPEAVFTEAQFKALEQNLIQMDTLLGAVRGYRSPGIISSSSTAGGYGVDNSRNVTVENGAIQLSGPDPYAVSLLTVNRLSEMAAL
jgi:tape measure domain-containing protein